MHGLLNRFFALALDAVHRYEGTVNQFLGDGFMALFGAPLAHEDHARRAVLAALGVQQKLHQESVDAGLPAGGKEHAPPVQLSVRMGLNTGLVVVGSIGDNLRMDYTAIGDTTNLAARLQQLAEPGAILLSETTARLVRSEVRLETLEPAQVKGKPDPVVASRVLGPRPRRSPLVGLEERALSPFVGRERELTTLHELLAQVEAGQGQVVGLVGEAGVGKSRLLFEFRQGLSDRRATYLEGRCLSYGSAIPYLPLMDILRNNTGITESDDPEAMTAKVRLSLQEVGLDPEEGAPYLLQLLGVKQGTEPLAMLSPEAIKTRTFATLRQMSLRGSQRQPLILTVEDLHWIDQTSEACFASLVESLAGAPILLLCTYRPGYRPPWLEKSYATQVALPRLTSPDSLTVVHAVLQRVLPDPLAQVILDKAEGNPFFLEELTRAVVEHGDLRPLPAVPDTIQGVLAARIDRLPEEPKRLLQTASVLGREFSLRLLGALWDTPDVLEAYLGDLKRLEFLYERTEAAEPVYIFKHVLTQEVAYDSLLTSRRQALHAAAGQALESLYAERLEEVYDRLAYHYAKTAESAKAIEYLTRFAEKAARGYAHAEAVTALQEALVHAGARQAATSLRVEQDRLIIDLVLRFAHSLYFLGRFQETLDLLLQQQARLERLQDPALTGPYYFWLSHTYSHMGDQERAVQNAQHAIAEAARCGDDATVGKAHYVLAREGYWSGQYLHGLEHGQQAVSLLQLTQAEWWLGQAHWAVGLNYYFMGEFAQSLAATDWTDAIGETLGDPRLQSYAAWTTGWIEATRGEWQAGLAACQHSLERAPDPLNTGVTLGFMGCAYLEKGDSLEAIAALEQAVQYMHRFRFRQLQGRFTTWLGEAYLLSGQIDKARDLVFQGLETTRDVKFWDGVGWAQRALGRIAKASGSLVEAESHLREALQTFVSIQARFEVGRTHLDLAALTHTTGNREATTAHLTEAHTLFTALQVPRYVARTEQRARELGVSLSSGPIS